MLTARARFAHKVPTSQTNAVIHLDTYSFIHLAMLPVSSLKSSEGDLGVALAVLGFAALAFEAGVLAGIVASRVHVKSASVP